MRSGLTMVVGLLLASSGLAACAPEGESSAFVTFNIPPDQDCIVSPNSDVFRSRGLYDVASGKDGLGTACENSYYVNLLVNSYLRPNEDEQVGRSEPNYLLIHSAEVTLKRADGATLDFAEVDPPLPNPFLVTTGNSLEPARGVMPSTGIAAVEAIPAPYAEFLGEFDGSQILAEIQIFGETTGGVDVEFRPFTYPIRICDGCLTVCDFEVEGMDDDDVFGDRCRDNAGADGRICIDDSC